MGTYKVNPDGKAPLGLGVGDMVVTGGGVYLITGFAPDGSYVSMLLDADITTYNYTGKYDVPSSAGSNAGSNAGSSFGGNAGGNASGNNAANNTANNTGSVGQWGGSISFAPYEGAELPDIKTLSFEQAMKLAQKVMEPQYDAAVAQAADGAAQNLERAGLYDTLYGQALSAQARSSVAADVNSAIIGLALELSNISSDQAQKVLELAVKEKQFAAEYDAKQKSEAMDYLLKLMQQ